MVSAVWFVYYFTFIIYTISYGAALIGGVNLNYESIGKNIRAYRMRKKMRQEDLAELTGLSVTYIGMVERGEKLPALETFISILNALEVSSDVILADVLKVGYEVKSSIITEELSKLSAEERERVYDVIATLIKHSK
jgi:transcriptional regulator with XRE-family HTH domain